MTSSSTHTILLEPRDYIGKSKWTLPTPCLVLDVTSFQRSLDEMHAHVKRAGKHVRPHTKSHKCVTIAKKQIEAGAVGICVAKVSEALVFAKAGISGTLITSPVTTPHGLAVLHTILTRYDPHIRVVCDSLANVIQLCTLMEQIQAKQGADNITRLGVLVDMDGGQGRTGALPDDVIPLVQTIYTKHAQHLDFQGIQCYLGHIQHITSFAERRDASLKGMARACEIVRQLRAQQIPCQILTGAGTGTSDIDIELPELTDLQVGSYCLLDAEYLCIASRTDATQFTKSRPTLTLLSTIISANHAPKHVTCDAGLKAMYKDGGTPKIIHPAPNVLPLTYDWFGDEHGAISVDNYKDGDTLSDIQTSCLKVGNVIEMIVSHCDPTVNLHDYFFVTRDDEVIDVWSIEARGNHNSQT